MNLSVLERLTILKALPQNEDYASLKILQTLRMSLSFTEKEIKEWNIKSDMETGVTSWEKGAGKIDIPIGEKATDLVKAAFKKLNAEKKLDESMLGTYERFISTTE